MFQAWPNHTFNRTLRGAPSLGQNSSPNSARRKVPVNFYVRRLKLMPELIERLLKTLMFTLAVGWAGSAASNETFDFQFWPAPAAQREQRFLEMHHGPCGEVATARVQFMPSYSNQEPFAPERVFEIDSKGKTFRTWNIPVEADPYALVKNVLLFSYNANIYRVTSQGRISKVKKPIKPIKPTLFNCKVPKAFHGSDYARCWRFVELGTNNVRLLVYQGVCT